jgi:hypothetical protein
MFLLQSTSSSNRFSQRLMIDQATVNCNPMTASAKEIVGFKKTFQKLVKNLLTESVSCGIIRLVVAQTAPRVGSTGSSKFQESQALDKTVGLWDNASADLMRRSPDRMTKRPTWLMSSFGRLATGRDTPVEEALFSSQL